MKNTMQYIQSFLKLKGDQQWQNKFLLTFESLDLQLAGIFLSTPIGSPLMSGMNIARVKDNGPSRSSCLKHTVPQSKVVLLTAGRSQKRGW